MLEPLIKMELSRDKEKTTLFNLGEVYNSTQDYAKAIEPYQQAIAVAKELKDRQGEHH